MSKPINPGKCYTDLQLQRPGRAERIEFIFDGNVPVSVDKNLFVCAKHFLSDCITNQGQYNAGLAMKLFLKKGSAPTVKEGNVI